MSKWQWVELGLSVDGEVRPRGKCAHVVLRERRDKAEGFTPCSLRGHIAATRITKPKCKTCLRVVMEGV